MPSGYETRPDKRHEVADRADRLRLGIRYGDAEVFFDLHHKFNAVEPHN